MHSFAGRLNILSGIWRNILLSVSFFGAGLDNIISGSARWDSQHVLMI